MGLVAWHNPGTKKEANGKTRGHTQLVAIAAGLGRATPNRFPLAVMRVGPFKASTAVAKDVPDR